MFSKCFVWLRKIVSALPCSVIIDIDMHVNVKGFESLSETVVQDKPFIQLLSACQ